MAEVVREITFKQSQGHNRLGQLVKFAQDEILVNGVRVGYVGHAAGDGIALIRPVCDVTKAEIEAAVTERRGSAPQSVKSAPPIPDELLEDSDDE